MANLPRISRGQIEVVTTGDALPQIQRAQLEVITTGGVQPRLFAAALEAIILFDGPIAEPKRRSPKAIWVGLD